MRLKAPIEPGLIRIFRFFAIAETVAFLLVPLGEWLVVGSVSTWIIDPFYIIFTQAMLLSIYLSIPWLQRKLRHWYLLIALLAAIFIPTILVNVDLTLRMSQGQAVELYRLWALLPLLMIPLVPAAWQYDFRTVFLLFAGLGMADGLYLIIIFGGFQPDLLMPLFAIFIRVVTLTLVGLMITELLHTQREQRRELMRANLQLSRQTLVQEQLAISHERNRLARELHDTLAHTLSGLSVQLEAIHTVMPPENNEVLEMVELSLETARTGLEETRRALKALRAEPIEDLGLNLALRNLVLATRARAHLQIHLNLPEKLDFLNRDEEQAIYRITQEALENVVRHAEAGVVSISLLPIDKDWILEIRDDGKGFDYQLALESPEHMGLRGIQERSAGMNAAFNVVSQPGKGTTLHLRLRKNDDSDSGL
ncbi:MAG: hypothetical protein CVU39_26040 [Chloroflexi bacterium HGW-Chloroflexi-10]|nr:MAG: hypothetical protein CVU39_26040 [Chloroflexi bacterium HGW-Chloroflexi-10]